MSFSKHYNVGIRNVGSYQVSGWPWMTGSDIAADAEHHIGFPSVTKAITVIPSGAFGGTDAAIRVHFAPMAYVNGTDGTHHYITLESADSITMNIKCTDMYITGVSTGCGYEVFAELTSIPTASMSVPITGSGISE